MSEAVVYKFINKYDTFMPEEDKPQRLTIAPYLDNDRCAFDKSNIARRAHAAPGAGRRRPPQDASVLILLHSLL